jgi:transposase-like protein
MVDRMGIYLQLQAWMTIIGCILLSLFFFESESGESWTWFLMQLRKAIGETAVLAIHSDACKGLTSAVHEVFPHAERRECFRHLMQNYIKQFSGKEHMYPAARAYRSEVYEQHKANFIDIDNVALWLKQNHSLLWYRSGFNPDIKCDYITNNIA